MASFKKYKNNSGEFWLFKMTTGIDPETGKYKHTTRRGFKTKKEAQIAASQMLRDIGKGKKVTVPRKIFGEVLNEWLESYEVSGVKTSTIINRKTTGIPHLLRFFNKLQISAITRKVYQNKLNDLANEGYAKGTIDTVNIVGRMVFKYAIEQEYIRESPVTYAKLPLRRKTIQELKELTFDDQFLEKCELIQLLEVIKKEKNLIDYAIFLTLSYTGMRIGELLALQWDDINFKENSIRICKTLFREKNTVSLFELTPPKTFKSNRLIAVDTEVIAILSQLFLKQEDVKKQFPGYLNENFVFAKLEGEYAGYPELRRRIGYRLNEYLRKAKITKPITLHKFRHTHVSLLAQSGVSLPAIQERLGHESSETTTGVYLHVTKELNQEIVTQFSKLLKS